MNKMDIKSMNIEELKQYFLSIGEKTFRANQVFKWIHQKLATEYNEMTNISKQLENILSNNTKITDLKVVTQHTSKIDGTIKYLFELEDGNIIESVLMRYKHGNSVCISSQVGCKMGCKFCASTIGGLIRNLTASEMLDQIYKIQKFIDERISNVVVMGTGEPLDNYEALINFIKIINHKEGLNISERNITVSTCGLVDKIKKLADEEFSITLAISLHASNDKTRQEIMPIGKNITIKEILKACKYYIEKTNRRITFEYSIIKDVNDNIKEAKELGALLKGILCHINLIPINPIDERSYKKGTMGRIRDFKNVLEENGLKVTIRRELGQDINAACGQLRKSYINNNRRNI